jgi:hypothetical protein
MAIKTRRDPRRGALLDWEREVEGFDVKSTVVCIRVSKDGSEIEVASTLKSMIRRWVPREQLSCAIED